MKKLSPTQKSALHFILLFGIISMFADMTYEGARSTTGAYLGFLGASAAFVGFVSGLGELLGYSLRFVSGFLVDRTKKYWAITLIGYAINLLAVPLLAFTQHIFSAAILILLERIGKAIRVPARDTMLSHAGQSVGMGKGFAIHEALDQFGAMVGPLILAGVFFIRHDYHLGFAVLALPALCALSFLLFARIRFPQPENLASTFQEIHPEGITRTFWIYLIGACFVAAGFADFPLIAYHFQKHQLLSLSFIPITYAIAMGVNSLFTLLLGTWYDRKGFIVLIIVTIVAAFFAPLVFLGNSLTAYLGVALWSIGISAQQTLMRAFIGNLIKPSLRGSAFGIFNFSYGISWFLGSVLMGIIYDHSIHQLVIFIMALQLVSIPWFIVVMKKIK